MGRTKEIARRGAPSPWSLKRKVEKVRTRPKPVLVIPSSSSESQEEDANSDSEMPQQEEANSEPDMMPQNEENGSGAAALVDRYEATVREVSWEEYDQALKERDLALNELNNLKAEQKEVQNDRSQAWAEFELGKKVWEAEKKALTERLDKEFNNFAAELKEVLKSLSKSEERTSQERDSYQNNLELGNKIWEAERIEMAKKITMVNKEKEKAYCKGYLDGWFKKPHAYVHAWHDANLADDVTDLPVLQMMSKLPKSHP